MSNEKARQSDRIDALPKKKAVEPFAINLFLINNQYTLFREWLGEGVMKLFVPLHLRAKNEVLKCEERKESPPK